MSELFGQLGINWRLLVTQGVNFFALLAILTFFAYRPLLRLLDERRKKIELGLQGAEEAQRRLDEIERLKSERLAKADRQALAAITQAEKEAQTRGQGIIAETRAKALSIENRLANANRRLLNLERRMVWPHVDASVRASIDGAHATAAALEAEVQALPQTEKDVATTRTRIKEANEEAGRRAYQQTYRVASLRAQVVASEVWVNQNRDRLLPEEAKRGVHERRHAPDPIAAACGGGRSDVSGASGGGGAGLCPAGAAPARDVRRARWIDPRAGRP
jgi:F0F1-type ATP synthase membrane subunit b/b'